MVIPKCYVLQANTITVVTVLDRVTSKNQHCEKYRNFHLISSNISIRFITRLFIYC